MSATTIPAARSFWPRRLLIPVCAVGAPAIVFALIQIWHGSETLSRDAPEAIFPLYMAFQITLLLGTAVAAVWFLFLSGLRLRTKAIAVLMLAVLVSAVVGVTRRVEFRGMMRPVWVFRWQPDIGAELDERLASTPAKLPALTAADLAISQDDFPRYRGANADGVVAPLPMASDWSAQPPKVVWRTPVGWAYSGIAVAGKVAVTIEQRGDNEAIVCYDRGTGEERWQFSYPAKFVQSAPMGGSGPRSTPTIAPNGDVFALGALGDLVCVDGTTGSKRWSVNILTDNGAKNVQWGMTGSPLLAGDLVVVNAGIDPDNNQKQAVAAYDRKTGKKAWAVGEHPAAYSSPMLATFAGVQQILLFDGGGVAGIDPADGKELWRYPWKTQFEMNLIQPVVLPGDRVLVSSEQVNGCAVFAVKKSDNAWSAERVWANRNLAARFASPVYFAGHIYGLTNGRLCCLDAATGKRAWSSESGFESGQLLLSGKTLLVQTEGTGELVAVAADPAEYRELGRVKVFRGSRTWNTPAVAGGRLYLRNHEEMVCLDP